MKYFVFLLNFLVLAIVLAAVLAALAFAPVVQTWIGEAWLARQSDVKGSLGSLSAHFGKLEISELDLQLDGAHLTVPSLHAELPLTTALFKHRFLLRRLVAKGWTLDLRQNAETPVGTDKGVGAPKVGGAAEAVTPAPVAPAENVARIFRGILSRGALPCDVSLDGAELEGDVVLAAPVGTVPMRVHVVIKGGGIAAGREGEFAFDASSNVLDPSLDEIAVAGHGHLVIAMTPARTLDRIEVNGDLSANGGPFPNGLTFSADLAAARGAGDETYSVDVSRGGQHLAKISVQWQEAADQFAGTWRLDLKDSDVALFTLAYPLPHFTATGEGKFDFDVLFKKIHAVGHIKTGLSGLAVFAPWLERLEPATVEADFDGTRVGRTIQIDRLNASMGGAGTGANVHSLQAFEVDERTGELKPRDPAGDWIDISIHGFPLAWLSESTDALSLSGGNAAGEFLIRTDKGGFAARSKTPLISTGVSVQRTGHAIASKLDLSLSLVADHNADGWHFQASPLIIGSAGRRLATVEAKGSFPTGPDESLALTGTWDTDLQAVAAVAPDLGWIRGRAAAGDFSATVGSSTEVNGKLTLHGQDERHSIAAGVHAEIDADGRISFLSPVKISDGSGVSDVTTEGTWLRDQAGTRFYIKLSGKDVFAEHLRLIATSLAAAGGASLASTDETAGRKKIRDAVPFWGDWAGRVTVGFGQVKAGTYILKDVGGAVRVDHGSVHLEGGQGALGEKHFTNLAGSILFDAAAEMPYSLKASASLDKIEADVLFPAADYKSDPPIEGQFAIAATVLGDGINLQDLLGRAHEEFNLTSTAGIVRVLKTDVNEAIPPETESPVSEDLGRVGSGVGSIFGVNSIGSGKRTVSPTAETVIRFINDISEIGYDQAAIRAVRESDGTIRLEEITMTAPDEMLKGSGSILGDKGLSLRARPLSVDLRLSVRGTPARHSGKAGLLSATKDDKGYTMLMQPIHFGGTLEHMDLRGWHDLLVKAAEQAPVVPPKKVP